MTVLFLDGKKAVIDEGQSLKLVREDAYFTKSGTYTYNIALPALCPENIAIFGPLARKDVSKAAGIRYSASLLVDNREILNGTATVTAITDTEIKVQLMGGNSELNFYTKNEMRYLDELELGTWYEDEGISSSDLTMREMAQRVQSQFNSDISTVGLDAAYKMLCKRLWNENTKDNPCKWVALPCTNEKYDIACNNFGIKGFVVNAENRYYTCINDLETVNLSVQPYLVPMIERIFEHLGYPVAENCLRENDFFMKIVIVTANNRSAIARSLPHWTVAEFIKEIENLFAVVIYVDEVTKMTVIRSRSKFFDEQVEYIDKILEEYSVDMDVEKNEDIANANVGYSEVSEYDRIEQDIKELARYDYTFDNEDFSTGLQNLVNHLTALRRADTSEECSSLFKYRGTIFKICGRSAIIELFDHVDDKGNVYQNQAKVLLVDEFAYRLKHDGTDIDIELKICPSKYTADADVSFYNSEGVLIGNMPCYSLVKSDNTDPTGIEGENSTYIAGLISGETDIIDTKEDLMSVCLYDGGFVKRDFNGDSTQEYFRSFLTQVAHPDTGVMCFYPSGYLMSTYTADTYHGGGQVQKYANESLALNIDSFKQNIGGRQYTYRTFYSEVFKNLNKIDTQVKYCFKFLFNRIDLKVNSTFIIRNKRFVCEKLEYNIKADGMSQLVTGYFYELEE